MFELGNYAKDIDYEGIIVAKVEYLNGCVQYLIVPKVGDDNKYPDGEYIDEERLIKVDKGITIQTDQTGGGTRNAPPKIYR